jgi:hypothetical protein
MDEHEFVDVVADEIDRSVAQDDLRPIAVIGKQSVGRAVGPGTGR